jgi:Spy/CpxP family protein refolding chaperone
MKNKRLTLILVLSLSMNAAFLGVTGYGWYSGNRPAAEICHLSGKEDHFYQELGLTPAQLAAMQPLADQFHQSLDLLSTDMGTQKESMVRLLENHDGSSAQIEDVRRDMAVIQDRIQQTVINHVLDVKKILDLAQQNRFFHLLRKNMQARPEMFTQKGKEYQKGQQ